MKILYIDSTDISYKSEYGKSIIIILKEDLVDYTQFRSVKGEIKHNTVNSTL